MDIEIKNTEKLVLIWASNAEQQHHNFSTQVHNLCRDYQTRKFRVILMRSGSADLLENSHHLLQANQ